MKRCFNFLWIATIIVFTSMISCSDDDNKDFDNNKCNVSNPTEDLVWLKEAIDEVKEDEFSYYVMANYKGETVFYYGNCDPTINYASFIQNCNGENIGNTNDLQDELSDETIVWKHAESKCDFQ